MASLLVLVPTGGAVDTTRAAEAPIAASHVGWMSTPRRAPTLTLLDDGRVLVVGTGRSNGDGADLFDPATGTFEPLGPLGEDREGHTATLLADSRVLLTGGLDEDGEAVADAEIVDPSDGRVSATGRMRVARTGHTASLLADGRVLLAGGQAGRDRPELASTELYDPSTGRFTGGPSLLVPRADHTATTLEDGSVLVVGGTFDGEALSMTERYDPHDGRFTAGPDLPGPRAAHSAARLPSGAVLVWGGVDDEWSAHFDVLTLDPATSRWDDIRAPAVVADGTSVTPLLDGRLFVAGRGTPPGRASAATLMCDPTERRCDPGPDLGWGRVEHAAIRIADGRVLLVGGLTELDLGEALASAELYDPSSGALVSSSPPLEAVAAARWGHSATLLDDGRVLIAGGTRWRDQWRTTATALVFEPAADRYVPVGDMTRRREGHSATLLRDGRVLIAGGSGSRGRPTRTAELFDPATGTFGRTGSMHTERNGFAAVLLEDGRVLVVGGEPDGLPVARAELYDPRSGRFTPTDRPHGVRIDAQGVRLADGRILVVGGSDARGFPLRTAELYDPRTGTFQVTGRTVKARGYPTVTLLRDGRVLLAGGAVPPRDWTGGTYDSEQLGSAEFYEPRSGRFGSLVRMGVKRGMDTATLLDDGRVLLAGGISGPDSAAPVPQVFDPRTGRFMAAGWPDLHRLGHTAVRLADGRVLLSGGFPLPGYGPDSLYDPLADRFFAVGQR